MSLAATSLSCCCRAVLWQCARVFDTFAKPVLLSLVIICACRIVHKQLADQATAGMPDPHVSLFATAQRLTRTEAVKLFVQVTPATGVEWQTGGASAHGRARHVPRTLLHRFMFGVSSHRSYTPGWSKNHQQQCSLINGNNCVHSNNSQGCWCAHSLKCALAVHVLRMTS